MIGTILPYTHLCFYSVQCSQTLLNSYVRECFCGCCYALFVHLNVVNIMEIAWIDKEVKNVMFCRSLGISNFNIKY